MTLTIKLSAVLRNGDRVERDLAPADYFDPPVSGEVLDLDSPPLHLDQRSLLDVPDSEIRWLKIETESSPSTRRRLLELRFWGDREEQHQASLVTDYKADQLMDWEHILVVQERDSEHCHIVKLGPATEARGAGLISHTRLREQEGGDECESLLR